MIDWFKTHLRAFKDAAGIHRYVLSTVIITLVGLLDFLSLKATGVSSAQIIGVPSLFVSIILAIIITWYWLLTHIVKLNKTRDGAYLELSKLRLKGVEIRNRGRVKFPEDNQLKVWVQEVEDWDKNVISALGEIDKGAAQWFRVLDIVPEPRLSLLTDNQNHMHQYRMHDRRLDNLGQLIRELFINSQSK